VEGQPKERQRRIAQWSKSLQRGLVPEGPRAATLLSWRFEGYGRERNLTPQRTDEEIDVLLGQGRVPPSVKDRVFDRMIADLARQEPRRRARAPLLVGFFAVAGVAAVLLLVPRSFDSGFRRKGPGPEGLAAAIPVQLACVGGTLAACPVGATLLFSFQGENTGFLAAYAQPRGGGERIWYFSGDGESPQVAAGNGTTVAPRAIRIGPEHASGDYTVRLFVTRAPAPRALLTDGLPAGDLVAPVTDVSLRVVAPPPGSPLDPSRRP
jgi:hypothetical protein